MCTPNASQNDVFTHWYLTRTIGEYEAIVAETADLRDNLENDAGFTQATFPKRAIARVTGS